MKTATRLDDLQVLGNYLQECLQAEFPQMVPFEVQCVFKEGALMILAQHPAEVVPDPQQTFSVLEQAIQAEQPEFHSPIKLYLRRQGTVRPYTFHRFTIKPVAIATGSDASVKDRQTAVGVETAPKIETHTDNRFIPSQPAVTDRRSNQKEKTLDEIPESEQDIETAFFIDPEDYAEPNPVNPWDQPIDEAYLETDELSSENSEPASSRRWRFLLPVMVAGAGVSVVLFFCSFYLLTRPCVLGACQEIPEAQALNKKSVQTLRAPRSGKDILEAQQQLTEAIRILESIPFWSSHHQPAQKLLKTYQAQAQKVNETVKALKQGSTAAQKSQNPPHTVAEWQEIQRSWREAIAQLEKVPKDSKTYPLAQQKLKLYKANLAVANKRLITEQQAKKNLEAAKEGALIAKARQGVAQTLENWQLVHAAWQIAVNRLKQVPQRTTAHVEAQQLLAFYQPQVVEARGRKVQEQFAANNYKLSLRMAQQAKNAQASNQWSKAVSSWRAALTYLNQVPSGTFYYSKAQPVINSYTEAFKQAQVQLQLATIRQQASKDLNQICTGVPIICNYTITNNVMKVRLTPAYAQKLRQTALKARVKGDYNAQIGVVHHVLTLGEALEAISDNARIQLEVYGPDGAMIQSHRP